MCASSDAQEADYSVISYPNLVIPSAEKLKEDVDYLIRWMSQEPHLPNVDDAEWIKTILYQNKFSLERTKVALDNYYTIRSKYPKIMLKDRNPTAMELLQARKALSLGVMDGLTKDGCKIIYAQFNADHEIFDPGVSLKRTFMLADAMNLERVRLVKTIIVANCANLSPRHYLKMTPLLTAFGDIMINAYTERIEAFYIVNTSRFIYELVSIMKKCVPASLSRTIRVHQSPDEAFRRSFDAHDLASDYGGQGPSLAEMDEYVQKLLEKHKTWFKEQENVCSNKLLLNKTADQLNDMKGSFRRLEID